MREVIGRAQFYLGLLVGNLVNLIDPQMVILGGGVVEALGEKYVEAIRPVAYQYFINKRGRAMCRSFRPCWGIMLRYWAPRCMRGDNSAPVDGCRLQVEVFPATCNCQPHSTKTSTRSLSASSSTSIMRPCMPPLMAV